MDREVERAIRTVRSGRNPDLVRNAAWVLAAEAEAFARLQEKIRVLYGSDPSFAAGELREWAYGQQYYARVARPALGDE